jgi:hypothetical protein
MEGILRDNKDEWRSNLAVLTMLQVFLHVDGTLMQIAATQCWPMKGFEKGPQSI